MISMSCQEFINRNFSDNQLGRGFHNAFLQYRIHISFLAIRIDWIFSYFQMEQVCAESFLVSFVFIMIASILVNWFFGLLIEELRGKRLCTFALPVVAD